MQAPTMQWAYPFESDLKRKRKNKAYLVGSIIELYLLEEMATFCSFYFDDGTLTGLLQQPHKIKVDQEVNQDV